MAFLMRLPTPSAVQCTSPIKEPEQSTEKVCSRSSMGMRKGAAAWRTTSSRGTVSERKGMVPASSLESFRRVVTSQSIWLSN